MTLGEILDTTFKVCTQNLLKFCAIGGVWILGYVFLFAVLFFSAIQSGVVFTPQTFDWNMMPVYFLPLIILAVFFILFAQFMAMAALTQAVGESFAGNPIRFGDCYRVAWSRFGPMSGTALLAGLAICLGFILLIVPGIILALAYCVLSPIVILEKRSGVDALKHAWFLMKGNKGKAFVIMLIIVVGQQVLGLLGLIPIPFLNFVVQLAVMIVAFVFGQAAVTVLYFHARAQKKSA